MSGMHVGDGGEHVIKGGYRSARSTQDGGSEKRRRQLLRKVVGAGIGMDSSVDVWGREDKGQSKVFCEF